MIELELCAVPEGSSEYVRVAGLVVRDDGTYTVDDPRGYLPIETPALLPRPDGQRGLDRVELADDAATWARQAHTILRTGYLVPVIVHDDGSPAGQDR